MWRLVLAFFTPKRWRSTSFIALLFAVTLLIFLTVLKRRSSSPIADFGAVYEIVDFRFTEEEIGVKFCPVCFGRNNTICEAILESEVKLRRKKEVIVGDKWKPRTHGLWNKQRISIKHFANASEFYKLDNELCSLIGRINVPCKVQDIVWSTFLNPSSIESTIQGTMSCPSERLMTKIKKLYFGNSLDRDQAAHNTVHLALTLNLNQEPLIFQLFPAESGWPFPKFYGACGRVIVIEDTGVPLDSLLSESFIKRAKLALDVIKIAKQLTSNAERWGLYLAEIALDNFAVANGKVKLIDANHILIVDLLDSSIKAENKKTIDECDRTENDCLSFFPGELCEGTIRDQNYYAVCRSLFMDLGSEKRLLHSPPEENEYNVLLEEALVECVTAKTIRREEAVNLIVGLLQSRISTQSES